MDTFRYDRLMTEIFIRGITMRELASRVGIHPETLRRKLNGQSAVTMREAFALRRALGVDTSLETLFLEADAP